MHRYATLLIAASASLSASAGDVVAPRPDPRLVALVAGLEDGPLKRELAACTDDPVRRTSFSLGHRGAPLHYPEHTRESYVAAAAMGAGVIECDVTFTRDKQLVCRHAQDDLHTTTDILLTPLAARCVQPFRPAQFDAQGALRTPAAAECRTSDITLAEFRTLRGKRDGFNPLARTVEEYVWGGKSPVSSADAPQRFLPNSYHPPMNSHTLREAPDSLLRAGSLRISRVGRVAVQAAAFFGPVPPISNARLLAALLLLCGLGIHAQPSPPLLAPDGVWCWFGNPRAVFRDDLLDFDYVRLSDGRVGLNTYDPQTQISSNLWLSVMTQKDDHDNPALLPLSDGRMLAIYQKHGGEKQFYYRVTSDANTAAAAKWGPELLFTNTTAGVTYANPYQLAAESGRIYSWD